MLFRKSVGRLQWMRGDERKTAPALPIAFSAGGGHHRSGIDTEVPPPALLGLEQALGLVSPPIEDGESCHVCGSTAVCLEHNMAWCRECAAALFRARGLKVQGAYPETSTPADATKHALRWHWLVWKLQAPAGSGSDEQAATFGTGRGIQRSLQILVEASSTQASRRAATGKSLVMLRTLRRQYAARRNGDAVVVHADDWLRGQQGRVYNNTITAHGYMGISKPQFCPTESIVRAFAYLSRRSSINVTTASAHFPIRSVIARRFERLIREEWARRAKRLRKAIRRNQLRYVARVVARLYPPPYPPPLSASV